MAARVTNAGHRVWTAKDDARLRELYPHRSTNIVAATLGRTVSAIYGRADILGLKKSAEYLASPDACRLRRGDNVGAHYRFLKGHVPANKGLRRPGWAAGRMRETQFKKGELSGRAKALLKPVGAERISKDGYLERKTHNNIPQGATREEANRLRARRWRAVHVLLWESVNGPLPAGHALSFLNGDKRDIRIDNLELITRAELMRRNTIHHLPAPLKETVQLLGRLKRQIRKRERDAREESDQRSA